MGLIIFCIATYGNDMYGTGGKFFVCLFENKRGIGQVARGDMMSNIYNSESGIDF